MQDDSMFLDEYEYEDYKPTEEDLKLLEYIKTRHSEMNAYRLHREKQWEESEKRIYDRIITPVEKGKQDEETAIRQPIEFAITYAKLSHLVKKVISVIIRGVEESDKNYEEIAQKTWEYKSREANLLCTLYNAIKKAIDNGESFLRVSYFEQYATVKLPKKKLDTEDETYSEDNVEEQEYCKYDGLVYELIDNKDIWVDENAVIMYSPHGVGSVNECIIRHYEFLPSFRKKFSGAAYKNVNSIKASSFNSVDFVLYYNAEELHKHATEGRWVVWYEYFNVERNLKVIIANGVVIYQGGISIGRIPVCMFKNIFIPNRLYSIGDPEILRGSIGFSNSLFNKMEQQAEFAVNPTILAGHGINPDEIKSGAGQIIPIRASDVRTAVQFLQHPDITEGAKYMLDYIQSLLINVSGINYNNLNAEPNQTAFGLALQQEQTLIRLALFTKYNEIHGLKDLVEISWLLLQKFFPAKKARLITEENGEVRIEEKYPVIRIKGKSKLKNIDEDKTTLEFYENEEYSLFDLKPEYIQGRNFDLEVVSGSMMDDMLLVKSEKLAKILAEFAKNPQWAQSLTDDMPKLIVETMGENPSKWIKEPEKTQYEDSELNDLELEWELLNASDFAVDEIVNKTTNATQHEEYLTKRLAFEYKELGRKSVQRIQEAIQFYLQAEKEQMLAKLKKGEMEQVQQEQMAQQQAQSMQNMQMPQGSETDQNAIQKKAAELSGGLSPAK